MIDIIRFTGILIFMIIFQTFSHKALSCTAVGFFGILNAKRIAGGIACTTVIIIGQMIDTVTIAINQRTVTFILASTV